jgi:uncharacterized protein with GYD domain
MVAGVSANGGSSRRDAAVEAVASLGGQLECLYFAFGDRDIVLIVDVPDDEAAKRAVEYRPPGS